MIKAVILDYAGAIVMPKGPDYTDMVKLFTENSDIKTEAEAVSWFKDHLTELEEESSGENFMTADEMNEKIIEIAMKEVHFKDPKNRMSTLMKNYWMYAPIHPDVQKFFDLCPLPVYVLGNHSEDYMRVVMRRNNLHPYGILSSESVRISKPSQQFFEKAGAMTSYANDEVAYVSSDKDTNVKQAAEAGLYAILLDRKSENRNASCPRVRSLVEIVANLNK